MIPMPGVFGHEFSGVVAEVGNGIEPLNIKQGDRVFIIGAGTIGLLHLLLLKEKRAEVAVTDINNKRLRIAKSLGANLTIKINQSPSPIAFQTHSTSVIPI